jgi:tRNA(adenine34) deaminase
VYSVYNIGTDNKLNHSVEVIEGVLETQCSDLLKEFFKTLRK